MINRFFWAISLVLLSSGCSTTNLDPANVEFISMTKHDSTFNITFLSETNFTTLGTSKNGSYVFCLTSKEIYNKDFQLKDLGYKYENANSLSGAIPKHTMPKRYKETSKFMYEVNLDYLTFQNLKNDDKVFYCRVITPPIIGSVKQTKVFKVY